VTPQPGGMEPTPVDGLTVIVCPRCGHELPPIAPAAKKRVAQVANPTARLNRAAELEDATPTIAHPVNPQMAPTDRIQP
jgi:hypothetical protein